MVIKMRFGMPKGWIREKVYNLTKENHTDEIARLHHLGAVLLSSQVIRETIMEEQEIRDTEVEYPKFSVITGGKITGEGDWLRELEKGTTFATRNKKEESSTVILFHVVHKNERVILLLENLNNKENYVPVDSLRFSMQMELVEIINKPSKILTPV